MQLDAINLARARCVLTFKRYIKKKTAPHLLGRIQVFEPVWLCGCGCVLLKTQFAAIWLIENLIYYTLGPT